MRWSQPKATRETRSGCPIYLTLEMLGDRWSLIVIRDIMFGNRRHYGDLVRLSEEGIASNILANRLVRLVQSGLLSRADDPTHKQKAIYSLTEASIRLVPLLAHMGAWGCRHTSASRELSIRAQFLEKGGERMWKAFMPNSEASTWERLRRVGQFPPSFRPLFSMPSAAKLRLEEAVRLDRLASRSGQALGYAHPPDSILINALVLRNLANLRVDDNPEVGSSVLLIGVARIQSNFEPMRKQVALFEL